MSDIYNVDASTAAFKLGIDAYTNQKPKKDNPYEQDSDDFINWNEGWLEAEFDMEPCNNELTDTDK